MVHTTINERANLSAACVLPDSSLIRMRGCGVSKGRDFVTGTDNVDVVAPVNEELTHLPDL